MLILSRKPGEKLMIGENIVVTVTRIKGNRVALGINAPQDVHVVRSELKPFGGAPVEEHTLQDSAIESMYL
jgi:carbon storage regulator